MAWKSIERLESYDQKMIQISKESYMLVGDGVMIVKGVFSIPRNFPFSADADLLEGMTRFTLIIVLLRKVLDLFPRKDD